MPASSSGGGTLIAIWTELISQIVNAPLQGGICGHCVPVQVVRLCDFPPCSASFRGYARTLIGSGLGHTNGLELEVFSKLPLRLTLEGIGIIITILLIGKEFRNDCISIKCCMALTIALRMPNYPVFILSALVEIGIPAFKGMVRLYIKMV